MNVGRILLMFCGFFALAMVVLIQPSSTRIASAGYDLSERASLPQSDLLTFPASTSTRTSTAIPSATCQPGWDIVPEYSGNVFEAVATLSANDVWVVGYRYDSAVQHDVTLIQHWNGSQWSVANSPNVAGGANYFLSISAISANDIWAAGYYYSNSPPDAYDHTLLEHWDGSTWSIVPSPNVPGRSNHLLGIAGASADDVWAVGSNSTALSQQALLLHWNGTQWNITASPAGEDSQLDSVSAISEGKAWAVGFQYAGGLHQMLIEYWDGFNWSIAAAPQTGTSTRLRGISMSGPNDIWAVGEVSGVNYKTLAVHWNGSQWSVVPSPNPSDGSNSLGGVLDISPTDVWAVGEYRYMYPEPGRGTHTLIEHWDGSAWSVVPSPNYSGQNYAVNYLRSAAGSGSTNVWAIGEAYLTGERHALPLRYTGQCMATVTPTGTATPTSTSTSTSTPTNTNTSTPTITSTPTETYTPSDTPYPTPTSNVPPSFLRANLTIDCSTASNYDYTVNLTGQGVNGTTFTVHFAVATEAGGPWTEIDHQDLSFQYLPYSYQGTFSETDVPFRYSWYHIWTSIEYLCKPWNCSANGETLQSHICFFSPPPTATPTQCPGAICTPTTTPTITPPPTHTPTVTNTPTATPTCVGAWNTIQSPSPGSVTTLNSVAAISSSDIWAVGYSNAHTYILHWDGTQWTQIPSPHPGTGQDLLFAVAAVSSNDVWAVGRYNDTSGTLTLIEHWNGGQWGVVPSPNQPPTPHTNYLFGVSAASSNDVWAVGYFYGTSGWPTTLIEHWDGGQWRIVPSLTDTINDTVLRSVTAISANDAWAVGAYSNHSLIEHWDGDQWSIVPAPNPVGAQSAGLTSVDAVSSTDVWAVGSYQPGAGVVDSFIEHWDGGQWSIVPSPYPGRYGELNGVVAISSGDVWAVGSYYGAFEATLIEHWDGYQWAIVPSPNPASDNFLLAVAAGSYRDVWAVGHSGQSNEYTLTEQYTAQCPSPVPTSTPSITSTSTSSPVSTATVACLIQFTDVPEGSTFYPFVRCMACRGIVSGYSSDCETGNPCFRPGNIVTRGQLSKIVSLAADFLEQPTTQTFADVQVGSTFYQFVEKMASRSIIAGYPCGGAGEPCDSLHRSYFRPNATATRGQIAKIDVLAAVQSLGWSLLNPPANTFEDVGAGTTFYQYVETAYAHSIISGYGCGVPPAGECIPPDNKPYFIPNNNATRGQSSKIVSNTFFPDCGLPGSRT